MARQILSLALLVAALSACAYSNECPAKEDLLSCSCYHVSVYGNKRNTVRCKGNEIPLHKMEEFRSMLQKNFVGDSTLDLHFTFSNTPTNLSSAFFNGLPVKSLRFVEWNMMNWADELGGKAFVGLEDSLEVLEVDRSITVQKTAAFDLHHLRTLKQIIFRKNEIPVFGNGWLGGSENTADLKSLNEISLIDNGIAELGDQAFVNCPKLSTLRMPRNEIKVLSRSMFANPAEKLVRIDLSDNKIEDLPEDIFKNMPRLQYVKLVGNPLKYLREKTWMPILKETFAHAYRINVEGTDLHCDDHINWLKKVLKLSSFVGTCKTPAEVAGQKITDVIEKRKRA